MYNKWLYDGFLLYAFSSDCRKEGEGGVKKKKKIREDVKKKKIEIIKEVR